MMKFRNFLLGGLILASLGAQAQTAAPQPPATKAAPDV